MTKDSSGPGPQGGSQAGGAKPSGEGGRLHGFYPKEVRLKAVRLFEKGVGYKQGARLLNVPSSTIRSWKYDWAIGRFNGGDARGRNVYPHYYPDTARRLAREGLSVHQISVYLKAPKGTVRHWVHAAAKPRESLKVPLEPVCLPGSRLRVRS